MLQGETFWEGNRGERKGHPQAENSCSEEQSVQNGLPSVFLLEFTDCLCIGLRNVWEYFGIIPRYVMLLAFSVSRSEMFTVLQETEQFLNE